MLRELVKLGLLPAAVAVQPFKSGRQNSIRDVDFYENANVIEDDGHADDGVTAVNDDNLDDILTRNHTTIDKYKSVNTFS